MLVGGSEKFCHYCLVAINPMSCLYTNGIPLQYINFIIPKSVSGYLAGSALHIPAFFSLYDVYVFSFFTDGRFGIRMANLRVPNFMVEWPSPISYPMFGCISHITCPFHIFPIWVCLKMWYTPQTGCFNGEPDAIQLELGAWFHIMHIFSYVLHLFPIPSCYQT
jgi:hypothetical protein